MKRLLAALRHLRAGHRIGCVEPSCIFWGEFVPTPRPFDPSKFEPLDLTDEEWEAFDEFIREPVRGPAPPADDSGRLTAGSRTIHLGPRRWHSTENDGTYVPDEAVRPDPAQDARTGG